ncbi:MAG: hypothetical protein U0798_14730 [Gemmataceae bacterium]
MTSTKVTWTCEARGKNDKMMMMAIPIEIAAKNNRFRRTDGGMAIVVNKGRRILCHFMGKSASFQDGYLIQMEDWGHPVFVKPNNFRRIVIGLAPIVCLLVFTQSASATCGDYVHILKMSPIKFGFGSVENQPTQKSPNLPCPCHGSECHQSPKPDQPSPTTPTTTNSSTHEAILLERDFALASVIGCPIPESIGTIQHFSMLIFHPPR